MSGTGIWDTGPEGCVHLRFAHSSGSKNSDSMGTWRTLPTFIDYAVPLSVYRTRRHRVRRPMSHMLSRFTSGACIVGLAVSSLSGCSPSKRPTGGSSAPSGPGASTTVSVPSSTARPGSSASHQNVLFAGRGIAVVTATDSDGKSAPALYASTDLTHWQVITPPDAKMPAVVPGGQGFVGSFVSASFLDSRHGWVLACDYANYRSVVFQTGDAGKSWQTIPDPGGDHCMESVQLLAPGVAIHDGQTNGYVVGVSGIVDVTVDDGKTWTSLFTVPEKVELPEVTPVTFADLHNGFSASGFVPFTNIGSPGDGYFQQSRDGGHTWTSPKPPSPGGRVVYDLPTFLDPQKGVLPVLGSNGPNATLQFDTTVTGGETWNAQTSLPINTAVIADSQYPYDPYPAVSIPSLSTWWVAQRGAPVSLQITVDGGHRWATIASHGLPAVPTNLDVLDGVNGLATVPLGPRSWPRYGLRVYRTNDAGQHWDPIKLGSD